MKIFSSKKTIKSLKTSRKISRKSRELGKLDVDLKNFNKLSLIDKIRNYANNVLIINHNSQKVKEVLTNMIPLKIKSGSGASFGIYKDKYMVKIYNSKFPKIIEKKIVFI